MKTNRGKKGNEWMEVVVGAVLLILITMLALPAAIFIGSVIKIVESYL